MRPSYVVFVIGFVVIAGVAAATLWRRALVLSMEAPLYAQALATSLAQKCPLAAPDDQQAFNTCRATLGSGPEILFFNGSVLFGGEQPGLAFEDKKLTWFGGDVFQRLYLSLFMFTGKWQAHYDAEGHYVMVAEAYFRNALASDRYPYPFWHSAAKWTAYERTNEIRFYLRPKGYLQPRLTVQMVTRSDLGKDVVQRPVTRAPFSGDWFSGDGQPAVTLFSEIYSRNNPHLAALDQRYRDLALELRNAECLLCHRPDGHQYMKRLSLLHTPAHAASDIDAALREVASGSMPKTKTGEVKPLSPEQRDKLLQTGEQFKAILAQADAWERSKHGLILKGETITQWVSRAVPPQQAQP